MPAALCLGLTLGPRSQWRRTRMGQVSTTHTKLSSAASATPFAYHSPSASTLVAPVEGW